MTAFTYLAATPVPYTAYHGTFIHTPEMGQLEVLENCIVGVDSNGTIDMIEVGLPAHVSVSETVRHLRPGVTEVKVVTLAATPHAFFFPGFVDTHIHAPQYPNTGIFGNSTLLDWLTTYTFPLEALLTNLDRARAVYSAVVSRTLAHGTTTAAYYATLDPDATNVLADVALEMGQRALVGRVCMNQNAPDFYCELLQELQDHTLQVMAHLDSRDPLAQLVEPILTPRFAPHCTRELMGWLGEVRALRDMMCQTHISENDKEIAWVKELFPECKHYADVYDQHKLLTSKTILAHAIHLSDEERAVVAARGSGVLHCPTSNSAITSGEARVRWLTEAGINVGLGTDVSGGYTPLILHVARHAHLVSRHLAMKLETHADKLSVAEVLYLATLGGAKVCSRASQQGLFAVGKQFDAQCIELHCAGLQVDVFEWQDPANAVDNKEVMMENVVAKWLFNGDDRNTTRVWVNGRCVVDKRAGVAHRVENHF